MISSAGLHPPFGLSPWALCFPQHHRWQSGNVECAGCWINADKHDDNPWTEQKVLLDSLLNSFLLADMLVDARTGYEEEAEVQDPDDPSMTLVHTTLGVRQPLPPPRIFHMIPAAV